MFSSKQMLLPLISIIAYLFFFYQTSLADDSKGKKASIEQCCLQVKNGACKNATLLAINRKIPKSCAILEPFCAKIDGRPGSEYDSIYDKLTAIAGEGYPGNGNELEPFDPSNPNVLLPSAKCMKFPLQILC